jgi:DNA-binding transcriptional MerR regulator
MRQLLQIGEVAKLIGVSPKTVRYYHEIGLLAEPERTEAGYRLYTANDLLRLQRIRRLRSLGLSLERIKEILGEPDSEREHMLRSALQSLVEELSAQILELEERRNMLNKLLALDTLDAPSETPLYFDIVKERLGDYFSNIHAQYWQWAEKVDAMLGAFHWPGKYRDTMKDLVQQVAEQPEQFKQLIALEERFAALINLPEDAPEVEQLVEDYARELGQLHSTFSAYESFGNGPIENAMMNIATTLASPAQRRFFDELTQRLNASPTKGEEVKNAGDS